LQTSRVTTLLDQADAGKQSPSFRLLFAVFLLSFSVLFLVMNRTFHIYDEGVILTDAMRTAEGQIPHRDFYLTYGPAQSYAIAWLFDCFGRSSLVERLYDLFIKASILAVSCMIAASYARRYVAVCIAIICGCWMLSINVVGSPTMPGLLLSLVGSSVMATLFVSDASRARMFGAGALTGLTALFRYDLGFALFAVHMASAFVAIAWRHPSNQTRFRIAGAVVLYYSAGVIAVFAPIAVLYLAVAPVGAFLHDAFIYPFKYYARGRHLPWPRFNLRTFDDMAVYIPMVVLALAAYVSLAGKNTLIEDSPPNLSGDAQARLWLRGGLVLYGLLTTIMILKGLVRIGPGQMFSAMIPALIMLAILYDHVLGSRRLIRLLITALCAFSFVTAGWTAMRILRITFLKDRASVLQGMLPAILPQPIREEVDWCDVPSPIHKGMCFLVDPDHAKVIRYLQANTGPAARIFVGAGQHDRIFVNDNITYFAANRLPATKWSEFDPLLQSRAEIQRQMIHEFDSNKLEYIVIDREFDDIHEPNGSSESSGVRLLDQYIQENFRPVETFGQLTIMRRR
jgi:hypothetical protein